MIVVIMPIYTYHTIKDKNEVINKIANIFEEYRKYFDDVANSPAGKYSIPAILEKVEESLNYLEIFTPMLEVWIKDYFEKNRGQLWLLYGLEKGEYFADYWKQKETNMESLQNIWPFLFKAKEYKGFEVDLEGAQREIVRQRKRQSTTNPRYKSYHPDGCPSNCCCWMLDDMEQWYTEEQEEIKASRNIYFNTRLQEDFYQCVLPDLGELKEQWATWIPDRGDVKLYDTKIIIKQGQTPIKILLDWIKKDFYYSSIIGMFDWSCNFSRVWNNINNIEPFIKCQREKLKTIISMI
jgi:hypothetical protein